MTRNRCAFCCVVLLTLAVAQCDVVVKTGLGKVRGLVAKSIPNQREYLAFTGIPYAKPPVNHLRFKEPLPAESWSGVLDATKPAPKCLQLGMLDGKLEGQEDCLYLNVFSPMDHTGTDNPKAVMVWVHGGGWMSGSGNGADDLYGPDYLMNEDLVLITINYRLNVFGFISTGDDVASGNYGLLDAVLALEWARDNAAMFGGDPKKVTIFGESAGAGAVHLLMLSPLAKGLFQRVIAQSGSAFCPWAVTEGEWDTARKVGAYAGCPLDSKTALIDCLREASAETLVNSQKNLQVFGESPLLLTPRIDKERTKPFLPESPDVLISTGQFNDVPLITGITHDEGYCAYAMVALLGDKGFPLLNEDLEKCASAMLQLNYTVPATMQKKAIAEIMQHYLGQSEAFDPTNDLAFSQMMSDRWFNKGFVKTLQKHSVYGKEPVFAYVYSHRGQLTLPDLIGGRGRSESISLSKDAVSHCDDVLVLFNSGFLPTLGDEDMKVSSVMRSFWTNFARYGSPDTEELSWPPINPYDFQFMEITKNPQMKKEGDYPFGDLSLWDKVSAYGQESADGTSDAKHSEL